MNPNTATIISTPSKIDPGADFTFILNGNLSLLTPVSQEAKDWLVEAAPDDAYWHGSCLHEKTELIFDLGAAAIRAGYRISPWTG